MSIRIFDVSSLGIRVLCKAHSNNFPSKTPKDVEGTLLVAISHDARTTNMMRKGNLLKLLYEGDDFLEFSVRWDNDVKSNTGVNNFYIRSFGKLPIYESIWGDLDLSEIMDFRPFYILKPYTKRRIIAPKKLRKLDMFWEMPKPKNTSENNFNELLDLAIKTVEESN